MELVLKNIHEEVDTIIIKYGPRLAKIKLTTEEFIQFKIAIGNPFCIINNQFIYKGVVICK